ncbi:MAG: flap endonuclease [Chloroflexi bacterium]|nr:flap endonuclease [Chloroflexota bacterium]MYD47021.1 flap endonuclease [Chloroflexota bacterium]
MKIHLVDGTYELFRAHYSPRPGRSAPNGQDVKATHGLAQSLIALLNQPDVTHIGVAFDTVIRSFRNDLFDGYKTGDGVEPDLLAQFSLAEQITCALGLTVWPMEEFEADDAIAAAAVRFAQFTAVEQVLMCSPDKDLAQVVSGQRVVMLDRRKGEVIDEAGVLEKFGVPPESIPDYLGLVGDAADGIPGIPRWGARSTAAILTRYRSIDAIPADAGDWDVKVRGADNLARTLTELREDARLYRQLAMLRLDAPLPETEPEQLRWTGVRQPDLDELCQSLNLESLLNRLPEPVPD